MHYGAITSAGSAASPPPPEGQRFNVAIEAYVRLSFNDEIELTGHIGDATFTAASKSTRRSIDVTGEVGGLASSLSVSRLRFRSMPVKGRVMGQPISGAVTLRAGSLIMDGMAGEEPIRYELDGGGGCANQDRKLGVQVVAQAFYSEIVGTVDRIPDAAMVALLLPVRLARQGDA